MQQVITSHIKEYGSQPEVVLSSPGRFHLLGEHSWYFNDKTLSMAIDLPVYVAVSFRPDTTLRFYYSKLEEKKRSSLSNLKFRREDRWANSIKAVIYGFLACGFTCQGMDITIHSEILPSSGFGVNTAIKAATALAIRKLHDFNCSDLQLLQVIEQANRNFLGTENFLADNFTVLFGKENTCTLTDYNKRNYEHIPFNFDEYSIVLTDSKVPRISIWNENSIQIPEYKKLLDQLKETNGVDWIYKNSEAEINEIFSEISEDMRRKLKCVIREHHYVLDACVGLQKNDFSQFARSVNRSYENLRDLYLQSCPEIDWLIKRVLELEPATSRMPLSCSRITGKGNGRCTYSILKTTEIENYKQKLLEFDRIFGFTPIIYTVKPVAGILNQN